jgi:hypothetical protein
MFKKILPPRKTFRVGYVITKHMSIAFPTKLTFENSSAFFYTENLLLSIQHSKFKWYLLSLFKLKLIGKGSLFSKASLLTRP